MPGRAVPWASHGLMLDQRPSFTLDPLFHAGAYYVQEAASQFIDHIISQEDLQGCRVLDMCSAPGGKTTIYSTAVGEDGLVVPIMSMGGMGCISVLSNVVPKETVALCDTYFAGDVAGAMQMLKDYLAPDGVLVTFQNGLPEMQIADILGEERVIVSNIAGTTRDAIDSDFENETGKYCFIDTAGMRRKSKVDDIIEKYSNMRTISAIERSDVCLILIDANDGVTEQDTKIAGLVHEAGKAAIIVVNKWDAVENKETNTMRDMERNVREGISYMTYAPVVFLSALTGQRVDKLYQVIQDVHKQNTSRITTGALNSVLADATARVQPPTDKGRRLKIYYMTQASTKPPHFVIFCNDARLFHFSYQRYLENQIREVFGLQGTPVRITIRQKGDKEED